ncbi:MAG TPA: hypothetical protein VM577_10470, partial [Anaerovoracaceae bacterium]|nr:hypothetical protein [Anaerovoracaceae bacterium]
MKSQPDGASNDLLIYVCTFSHISSNHMVFVCSIWYDLTKSIHSAKEKIRMKKLTGSRMVFLFAAVII